MTGSTRIPALVFGEVAEDYDRVRPAYPAALVDDVLRYGGTEHADAEPGALPGALEVGAGTGKATVAFAARGVPVVAVEPDGAMADVLARHTARTPGVRIVRSTFEQYRPEREFGLLYCADAWHWTRPETRWSLAARALRPGGTLALFWNNDRIADPALRQAMLDTLTAAIPSITVNDSGATQDTLWDLWPGAELAEQPEFGDFAGHVYASHRTVSGRDYLTHMSTRSQCRMLAPPVRERLFSALADVFPDEVPLAADTALHLARRRPA